MHEKDRRFIWYAVCNIVRCSHLDIKLLVLHTIRNEMKISISNRSRALKAINFSIGKNKMIAFWLLLLLFALALALALVILMAAMVVVVVMMVGWCVRRTNGDAEHFWIALLIFIRRCGSLRSFRSRKFFVEIIIDIGPYSQFSTHKFIIIIIIRMLLFKKYKNHIPKWYDAMRCNAMEKKDPMAREVCDAMRTIRTSWFSRKYLWESGGHRLTLPEIPNVVFFSVGILFIRHWLHLCTCIDVCIFHFTYNINNSLRCPMKDGSIRTATRLSDRLPTLTFYFSVTPWNSRNSKLGLLSRTYKLLFNVYKIFSQRQKQKCCTHLFTFVWT